jgi:hypothetical protein
MFSRSFIAGIIALVAFCLVALSPNVHAQEAQKPDAEKKEPAL